jgi:hypothetical protein
MCEIYMLQPVNGSSELFATVGRAAFVTEPDLAELIGDPMTQALMAADRVDSRELCALITQVRGNLTPAPARRS